VASQSLLVERTAQAGLLHRKAETERSAVRQKEFAAFGDAFCSSRSLGAGPAFARLV